MAERITIRSSSFRPFGPPPDAANAAPLSSNVMCISNFRLSIFALVLLVGCSGNSETPEYSREDCIVRVDLEWLIENPQERLQARNYLGETLADKFDEAKAPLGGLSISDNGEQWYFQFREDCDRKFDFTRRAFDDLSNSPIFATFTYSVSKESITPGVDTISLRGDSWRD